MLEQIQQFSLQQCADRLEIAHRLYQYCRGVDRLDYKSARDAFHPDAFDDHGTYKGDVDRFLEGVFERHKKVPFAFHQIGNIFIEFAGADDAMCESYSLTWQSDPVERDPALPGVGAPVSIHRDAIFAPLRFVDHFTRRDGAWRIQHRTVLPASVMVIPQDASNVARMTGWNQSTRDMNDPSQILRKKLGLI